MIHIHSWLVYGNIPAPDLCCLLNDKYWVQQEKKLVKLLLDIIVRSSIALGEIYKHCSLINIFVLYGIDLYVIVDVLVD